MRAQSYTDDVVITRSVRAPSANERNYETNKHKVVITIKMIIRLFSEQTGNRPQFTAMRGATTINTMREPQSTPRTDTSPWHIAAATAENGGRIPIN